GQLGGPSAVHTKIGGGPQVCVWLLQISPLGQSLPLRHSTQTPRLRSQCGRDALHRSSLVIEHSVQVPLNGPEWLHARSPAFGQLGGPSATQTPTQVWVEPLQ